MIKIHALNVEMHEALIQSLVRELRSHMMLGHSQKQRERESPAVGEKPSLLSLHATLHRGRCIKRGCFTDQDGFTGPPLGQEGTLDGVTKTEINTEGRILSKVKALAAERK